MQTNSVYSYPAAWLDKDQVKHTRLSVTRLIFCSEIVFVILENFQETIFLILLGDFVHFLKFEAFSTLGTRGFFLTCDKELRWRQAEDTSGEATRKKPLAQSALVYRAGRTFTLPLICQSNQRSQANSKVITKGGTTRCSPKSHIISRITSLSFNKNQCFKSNLVTVQFSLIYVASV